MKIILRTIAVVLFIGTLVSCDKTNDFDVMCGYFDGLEKDLLTQKLTADQKFTIINEQVVKNLPTESSAQESWNAVLGFVPIEGRYALFKSAAEATLNKSGQCNSMQALLKDI